MVGMNSFRLKAGPRSSELPFEVPVFGAGPVYGAGIVSSGHAVLVLLAFVRISSTSPYSLAWIAVR